MLIGSLVAVPVSCQKKKSSGGGAAVDPVTECYNRGTQYRWENGMCVSGTTQNQYGDQNSMMQQCINNGGQWLNGQCQYGYGTNPNQCVAQPSFQGILQCIQQNTQSYSQLLQMNSTKVRGLEDANDDLQTLQEKTSQLLSSDLRTDMSLLKKTMPCARAISMNHQVRQMSKKLEFSDAGLQQQSQNFINSISAAAKEIQNRLNCPLKI